MKKYLLINLISFSAALLFNVNGQNSYFDVDLSLSSNGKITMPSIALQRTHLVGKKSRLKLSYGLRYNGFMARDLEYYSAPPEYFMIEEKTDTLRLERSGQSNIALYLGAGFQLSEKFEIGFNIDAVGYTFGQTRMATFIGGGTQQETQVSPNQITALLIGPNDIGMVKAEFYVGYSLNDKLTLRAGVGEAFVEYKTEQELQEGNNRFRGIAFCPMLACKLKL